MPANPPNTNKELPNMTQLKTIGTTLMAILALSAFAVAMASAAEPTKMLPGGGITFTSKGGGSTLLITIGDEFKCRGAVSTGTINTTNLGNFHTELRECGTTIAGMSVACTGAGDSVGSILMLGTFHYWLALLSGKLVAALVFLGSEVHYTCGSFLLTSKGCEAALAEPTEKLTTVTKDVFRETKSGVSDIRTVLPENATKEISCVKLISFGGGEFAEAAQTGSMENIKFEKGAEKNIEILMMNK
jgi:hypothetical protein